LASSVRFETALNIKISKVLEKPQAAVLASVHTGKKKKTRGGS
jgi:hypothetical protein